MIYLGIPTINNLKYLKQTLRSLKESAQRHKFLVLIVDNGSTDKATIGWINRYRGWDKIFNPQNLGVAAAWNQIIHWGLSHDDCKLIFILNNDIVLRPDCLDRMIESVFVEKYEAISGFNIGYNPITLKNFRKPHKRYIKALNFCCFGLSDRTIKRVGIFDEGFKLAYFEDNDYHQRMKLEGIKMAGDRWAVFTHYGSRSIKEGGVVGYQKAFDQNKKYFIKKWGFNPER